MDLKVNSINFNGKREVLYGLNKASKFAQLMEFGRTTVRYGRIDDHLIFNAAMRSYLDMATKDNSFFRPARMFSTKDLQPIKENLKDFSTQYGTLKPFGVFKDALNIVIKEERNNNATKKAAADELLKLLA